MVFRRNKARNRDVHPQMREIDLRTQKLVVRLEVATDMVEQAAKLTSETASRLDVALDRLESFLDQPTSE